MSTFENSGELNETVFSEQPMHYVTKSYIGKRLNQNTKYINGVQCKTVQKVH